MVTVRLWGRSARARSWWLLSRVTFDPRSVSVGSAHRTVPGAPAARVDGAGVEGTVVRGVLRRDTPLGLKGTVPAGKQRAHVSGENASPSP